MVVAPQLITTWETDSVNVSRRQLNTRAVSLGLTLFGLEIEWMRELARAVGGRVPRLSAFLPAALGVSMGGGLALNLCALEASSASVYCLWVCDGPRTEAPSQIRFETIPTGCTRTEASTHHRVCCDVADDVGLVRVSRAPLAAHRIRAWGFARLRDWSANFLSSGDCTKQRGQTENLSLTVDPAGTASTATHFPPSFPHGWRTSRRAQLPGTIRCQIQQTQANPHCKGIPSASLALIAARSMREIVASWVIAVGILTAVLLVAGRQWETETRVTAESRKGLNEHAQSCCQTRRVRRGRGGNELATVFSSDMAVSRAILGEVARDTFEMGEAGQLRHRDAGDALSHLLVLLPALQREYVKKLQRLEKDVKSRVELRTGVIVLSVRAPDPNLCCSS